MLWPGSLIIAADRFPESGVLIYAMMASGGDLGASVAPQLIGIVTDLAIDVPSIANAANKIGLVPEQLGMRIGMLIGMLFPLFAAILLSRIAKKKN